RWRAISIVLPIRAPSRKSASPMTRTLSYCRCSIMSCAFPRPMKPSRSYRCRRHCWRLSTPRERPSMRARCCLEAMLLLVILALLLLGCQHEDPAPPVPPPPEDLSTWAVPELVQPLRAVAPAPAVAERKPTAAEKVYDFAPGGTYQAPVMVAFPLDVMLEHGEEIRNYSGGDPALVAEGQQATRWEIKLGTSGKDTTAVQHLFLRATAPGLKMGLVITTTKRTYYLTCASVQTSPIRVVRWKYPTDAVAPPP